MKELITYPLNDVDYSAEDAGLFHCTRKSGVWYQDSFPIEVSGADNTIFIGKGLAWFSNTEFWGKVAAQKTKVSLDLEYADTVYDRIDVIALQFDANKNATNLIVKKGEAKTNPTIPSISRTEAVYELYLYAITRPAASLTVTSENVRDLRLDDAYCGLMADSVTSLDFPIVPVEKGGTGKNFLTPNSVLVGNGSENVKNIPSKTGALYVDGNQTEPKFDILPVNAGGTGADNHTVNSVLVGDARNPVKNVATANGALYATGANSAPKFATLPIAQGGTSATTAAGVRNNLGLGNTTGALPIANGGTGATTVAAARNNLGLGNTNGSLPIANGGTGATTASGARNALGLGNTTGALPVANGGTGATTAEAARKNLGLGSASTKDTVPVANGGTGATTAEAARANLNAASLGRNVFTDNQFLQNGKYLFGYLKDGTTSTGLLGVSTGGNVIIGGSANPDRNVNIYGIVNLNHALGIAEGGTGAKTASGARESLGIDAVSTDVVSAFDSATIVGSTKEIAFLGLAFVRLAMTVPTDLSTGLEKIAKVKGEKPAYITSLSVTCAKKCVASINTSGEISIRAYESISAGTKIYVSGCFEF